MKELSADTETAATISYPEKSVRHRIRAINVDSASPTDNLLLPLAACDCDNDGCGTNVPVCVADVECVDVCGLYG